MMNKLIEVAFAPEAINNEPVREKSIRHAHPLTLHLCRARRRRAECLALWFVEGDGLE